MNRGSLCRRKLTGSILCDGRFGVVCLAYVTSSIMGMLVQLVRLLFGFFSSLQ